MSGRKFSGYTLTVAAVTGVGLIVAYFQGQQFDPSVTHRLTAVLLAGALLLLLGPVNKAAIAFLSRRASDRKLLKRDPAARTGLSKNEEVEALQQRAAALKFRLQSTHGWRWRYRDRWLLLCGETDAIDQLVPGLRREGWAITPQAVLLYGGQSGTADIEREDSNSGDPVWLKELARLRRRRPIDATVVVVSASREPGLVEKAAQLAHDLYLQIGALGWIAPRYVLHVSDGQGWPTDGAEAIACTWSRHHMDVAKVDSDLTVLSQRLAERGVEQLKQDSSRNGMALLARNIEVQRASLAKLVVGLGNTRMLAGAVNGLFFVPAVRPEQATHEGDLPSSSAWCDANWKTVANHGARMRGRRVGWSFSKVSACCAMGLLGLWIAGSLIAAESNRSTIGNTEAIVARLAGGQKPVAAARDLELLQRQLDTLEHRQQHGAPWRTRFGLNHDGQLQRALWPHYQRASERILTLPLQRQLEDDIQQRNALSDQELADSGEEQVKAAYADLRTYLMLAQPQHTDAAFLNTQWLASGQPIMPSQSEITPGGWLDLSQRLIRFHVSHLKQHEHWAITPDTALIASARQSLSTIIGLQNSTEVVYQAILAAHAGKYPDLSLHSLLGSTSSRGLFSIAASVPGVYTKAAWDERISKAIEQADLQRQSERDWVLTESDGAESAQAAANELKLALRQRYFSDYVRAWEIFLNSAQWHSDSSLSGTIDQLTLLADAQRSPLLALFNAVAYQASAGASVASLGENLVNKAQQLVKGKELDPAKILPRTDDTPLKLAFDPLLRLHQSSNGSGNDGMQQPADMSLARYLERITAVRLKLQQIMMSRDPDALSRSTAQAILQGKTSDIADSRNYASQVGASLGKQWSGFGDALFERPLEQTMNVLLQPAAANLNELWRSAIVASWNVSFSGRYPFADSGNDASLPELARFVRPDGGLIAQFVETQLAGVLERQGDQWSATQADTSRQLQVDPEFIAALNRITRISNRLFAEGDARVRFEFKLLGTGGIEDMHLYSGEQQLDHLNHREQWQAMVWPGTSLSGATQLQWSSGEGGLRVELGADGRFGLIRLLGQAEMTQLDSAQYHLAWHAEGAAPLRMILRSEAGAGPLEVLSLRNFRLPQQIFMKAAANNAAKES